jgi:O-antigen chain-terminating methyltransferase
MIEPNNPNIDVDDLMTRIQREVTRRRLGPRADVYVGTPIGSLDTTFVESQLAAALQRAEVRRKPPERLNVFPWNRLRRLQTFALRVLAFVFKDQRQVNFALVAAARELVVVDRALHDRLVALEARVHQLEGLRAGQETRREADG